MKKLTDGTWVPSYDTHYQKLLDEKGWGSIYEYQKDRIASALQIVKGKELAIDIGANIGIYTWNLAKHFKKVIAIEPSIDNYKCLCQNVKQYEWRIDCINAAAGNDCYDVGLTKNTNNCGSNRITGPGTIKQIPIDSLQLDCCNLIKIDVEDYELQVIEGALETIERFKPVIILEERNPLMPNRTPQEIAEVDIMELLKPRRVLEDMGYIVLARLTHDFVLGHYAA